MHMGIRPARPAVVEFGAFVRLMRDLYDPARRAELTDQIVGALSEFERKAGETERRVDEKIARAAADIEAVDIHRAGVEASCEQSIEAARKVVADAKASTDAAFASARAESDRIVREAREIAEQKAEAIRAEDARMASERTALEAARSEVAGQAAAAEALMAEAKAIKADFERRRQKLRAATE